MIFPFRSSLRFKVKEQGKVLIPEEQNESLPTGIMKDVEEIGGKGDVGRSLLISVSEILVRPP